MIGNSRNTDYIANGVTISPSSPSTGEKVKIIYDGLLAKSGASHLYTHVGYGSQWGNAADYPMVKTSTGYEATVPVANANSINICFKDCANNWDNNSGRNYSFDVTQ